jgi:hypothetical protein
MKILDFNKLSPIDYGLLVVFIMYIVFPVPTPEGLAPYIDSPIGLVFMFVVTISLFVYTHPLLGILYIFVVYEVLRRNHHAAPESQIPLGTMQMATRVPKPLPSQSEKDAQLQSMNTHTGPSLEEEVISVRAPIGKGDLPGAMVETSFHPVADKSTIGASMF